MFKVGQKVICVDDSPGDQKNLFTTWVKEGEIYTVRECKFLLGLYRVTVEEITNPIVYIPDIMGTLEAGFNAKRFRDAEEYFLENVELNEVEEALNDFCHV